MAELVARDYAAAYRALLGSYRLSPSLETLFQLGILANAEGRRIEAQDILRRYSADPGHGSAGQRSFRLPHQTEVQRILEQPQEASGVVKVLGPAGSYVFVDERVVGVLPLALPLLVAVGDHVVAAEYAGRRQEAAVQAFAGQTSEILFDAASSAPRVNRSASTSVLLLLSAPELSAEIRGQLSHTLAEVIAQEGMTTVEPAAALVLAPELRACAGTLDCQRLLAQRNAIEHILVARVGLLGEPGAGQWRISASTRSVTVGEIAARAEQGCALCGTEQALLLLEEAAQRALQLGTRRGHGTLSLRSTPEKAEVHDGGQRLGTTPLHRPLFTGLHQLVVSQPGFLPRRVLAVVEAGKTCTLEVELLPGDPPRPASAPGSRGGGAQ